MMPVEVTKRLAEFAVNTRYDDIPAEVRAQARLAIIDSMGTVLAGTTQRSVELLRELATEASRPGKATVFGCDMSLSAAHAAFANAASAHALDYDNISLTVSGFVTTPILFALLGVAEEERGVSGRALLEAFIVGYEFEAAIARGLGVYHYANGWHSTATLAHFGAAVGVGKLLGLDFDRMRHAISIAASEASGLRTMVGNMLKAFHVAKAARNGITAGRLAERGFTGHPEVMETDWGFCNAFNGKGEYNLEDMLSQLGRPYDLVDPGLVIKVYPCCGLIHSALDGVLDLARHHNVRPESVKHVRIAVHELVPPTMTNDDPQTGYEGKFSAPFCMATALAERSVRLSHFTDARVRDPAIRSLMSRTEMVVHPELKGYETFLQKEFTDVRLELNDGRVLEQRVMRINNRGSKGRPAALGELREKFSDCIADYRAPDAAMKAFSLLEKLDDVRDIRDITGLLR